MADDDVQKKMIRMSRNLKVRDGNVARGSDAIKRRARPAVRLDPGEGEWVATNVQALPFQTLESGGTGRQAVPVAADDAGSGRTRKP